MFTKLHSYHHFYFYVFFAENDLIMGRSRLQNLVLFGIGKWGGGGYTRIGPHGSTIIPTLHETVLNNACD
jgi:hypothetical protein